MTLFEERAARNEALFREVNEQMERLARRWSASAESAEFVCECGNAECSDHVELPLEEYERVRRNPRRFIVLPGHVMPELEHVVTQTARYVIVEKDAPAAVRVVEQHEPRRRG